MSSQWFDEVASTIADYVDDCGGVAVVVSCEFRAELIGMNPRLADCPESVWQHYRLSFRNFGLSVCGYDGPSDRILLIFEQRFTEEAARRKVERDGVSEAVQLELLDQQLEEPTLMPSFQSPRLS